MEDAHITMLSSLKVTAQTLLDNMILYKVGYYDIDDSTNFKLSEAAIRAFREKLRTDYSDTETYIGKIQSAVSWISDISNVGSFIGGGTTIFGIADSTEGAQDIYYGSIGNIDSTAVNSLKEVVFQENEDVYYLTESAFAFSSSAMIPIGTAGKAGELTFRSGTVSRNAKSTCKEFLWWQIQYGSITGR